MMSEIRLKSRVLPGNRIELTDPALEEGEAVDVIISPSQAPEDTSILEFLNSLPSEPRLFKTPTDVDRHLQQERDSWDR